MKVKRRILASVGLGLAIVVAAGVTPAAAGVPSTFAVSGRQIAVNEDKGIYKLKGGLVGDWVTTAFVEVKKAPLYRAKGTERFTGCLDRNRDRSCSGDPSGTIDFRFRYWARYGPAPSYPLIWGSCWHPTTGGTGAFEGVDGVVTFVDSPQGSSVSTSYVGSITLANGGAAAHRASARRARGCGATR